MSPISKEDVVNLREKTGAGLIDCKRALADSNGDMEEAISILRKKGVASAAKKAGRDAGEGIIAQYLNDDRSKGILVEVNCETDFVAKNKDFISFSQEVAQNLLGNPEIDWSQNELSRSPKLVKILGLPDQRASLQVEMDWWNLMSILVQKSPF
jgi:translation elongation factor Ts